MTTGLARQICRCRDCSAPGCTRPEVHLQLIRRVRHAAGACPVSRMPRRPAERQQRRRPPAIPSVAERDCPCAEQPILKLLES